jgi:hypothetical protein
MTLSASSPLITTFGMVRCEVCSAAASVALVRPGVLALASKVGALASVERLTFRCHTDQHEPWMATLSRDHSTRDRVRYATRHGLYSIILVAAGVAARMISRTNPVGARQRSCLPATRLVAWRRTSPSCRSWCCTR